MLMVLLYRGLYRVKRINLLMISPGTPFIKGKQHKSRTVIEEMRLENDGRLAGFFRQPKES